MTPLRKYQIQRIHAKDRGISFELTFEEWINIWEQSGKFEFRGRGKGKYCMSRVNDSGPYKVGNVYINLNELNAHDAMKGKTSHTKGKPHTAQGKANISAGVKRYLEGIK
jgi:hypothetical protein